MSDNICEGCIFYQTAKMKCVGDIEYREFRTCGYLGLEILEIVVECNSKEEITD